MTDEKGLVTVGLMTHNRAGSYLKATVDSILAQTYKKFELIISDNASTDNTEEVCRAYAKKDPRVIYVKHEKDIGYIANVNFLPTQGRGEYFIWVCDDDLFAPTFLEKCVAKLAVNPAAVMAGTSSIDFDDDGNRTSPRDAKNIFPSEMDLYRRLKQYTLFYESDGKDLFMFSAVWRREVARDYKFINYFVRYPYHFDFQDMNFVFRGLSKGVFEFTNEAFFFKRAKHDSFGPLKEKSFARRMFDTLVFSRLWRLFTPFFYRRMKDIWAVKELSVFARAKLTLWTLFVMSRLFWKRKI
jgi:glycosyltransferase involved in cell wall biosynthesis